MVKIENSHANFFLDKYTFKDVFQNFALYDDVYLRQKIP